MDFEKIMKKLEEGDIENVKIFIRKNPDKINRINSWGMTLLMAACQLGKTSLITFLIEAGSFLDMGDRNGNSALHHAIFGRQLAAFDLMMSKGSDINDQDLQGCTPLHRAVQKGYQDLVEKILNSRGKYILLLNKQNEIGATALHIACMNGNSSITRCLLQHPSINVNIADSFSKIPLHWACECGYTDIVQQLLDARSDMTLMNKAGNTPLHVAVQEQKFDVLKLMLFHNSTKMDVKNQTKTTPFLLAVSLGHLKMINEFISHRPDINAIDQNGNNCLHIAAKRAKFHSEDEPMDMLNVYADKLALPMKERLCGIVVACYLAHQGANFYYKNKKGQMPLDIIKGPQLKMIVKTLFQPQCILCEENEPSVTFYPCKHTLVCRPCSCIKLKRCLDCQQIITFKGGYDAPNVEMGVMNMPQPLVSNSQELGTAKRQKLSKMSLQQVGSPNIVVKKEDEQ